MGKVAAWKKKQVALDSDSYRLLLHSLTCQSIADTDRLNQLIQEYGLSDFEEDIGFYVECNHYFLKFGMLDEIMHQHERLIESKLLMNAHYYDTLIKCSLARESVQSAINIMQEMMLKGIAPSPKSYHSLMSHCFSSNQIDYVADIVGMIKQ